MVVTQDGTRTVRLVQGEDGEFVLEPARGQANPTRARMHVVVRKDGEDGEVRVVELRDGQWVAGDRPVRVEREVVVQHTPAVTTTPRGLAEGRNPMSTMLRWLLTDGMAGELPSDPLRAWFDGGGNVPMAGLRDALKADGWTAQSLQAWFLQHLMGGMAALHAARTHATHPACTPRCILRCTPDARLRCADAGTRSAVDEGMRPPLRLRLRAATAASRWSDAARVAPGTAAGRVVGTAAVRDDRRRVAADATVGAIGAAARATVTAARRGVGRVAPAQGRCGSCEPRGARGSCGGDCGSCNQRGRAIPPGAAVGRATRADPAAARRANAVRAAATAAQRGGAGSPPGLDALERRLGLEAARGRRPGRGRRTGDTSTRLPKT